MFSRQLYCLRNSFNVSPSPHIIFFIWIYCSSNSKVSLQNLLPLLLSAQLLLLFQDKGIKENEHHKGARVGIVSKPSAEFVAGILGTWLSGGCAVPLALSYPESELLHVMNDSVCL